MKVWRTLMLDLKRWEGNTTLPEPAMATTPLQPLRGEERRRWESTCWKRDWGGLDSSLEQDRRNPEKRGEYDDVVVVVVDLGPETWDTRDVDTIAIATSSTRSLPFKQTYLSLCLCFFLLLWLPNSESSELFFSLSISKSFLDWTCGGLSYGKVSCTIRGLLFFSLSIEWIWDFTSTKWPVKIYNYIRI